MVRIRSDRWRRTGAALVLALSAGAAQALEVFACEPEWAALARVLAPDATVTSATHALQDPHHIEARPALIGALRRADLAVCTGASLEIGWLPVLQQRAGNPRVLPGQDGLLFAEQVVTLVDKRDRVDRSMGDVHAEGNPHLHLDPRRVKAVAQALAERLARVDPANAAAYRQRYAAWAGEWDGHIAAWTARARPLQGRPVAAQHTAFTYLWDWLGMRQVADLEPKPGLPPTMSHLTQVLQQVKQAPSVVVVRALHQDPQASQWLARQAGVPLVVLPATVTADGPTARLDGYFDTVIDALLRAAPPAAVAASAPAAP